MNNIIALINSTNEAKKPMQTFNSRNSLRPSPPGSQPGCTSPPAPPLGLEEAPEPSMGEIMVEMFGHLMNIRACNVKLLKDMRLALNGPEETEAEAEAEADVEVDGRTAEVPPAEVRSEETLTQATATEPAHTPNRMYNPSPQPTAPLSSVTSPKPFALCSNTSQASHAPSSYVSPMAEFAPSFPSKPETDDSAVVSDKKRSESSGGSRCTVSTARTPLFGFEAASRFAEHEGSCVGSDTMLLLSEDASIVGVPKDGKGRCFSPDAFASPEHLARPDSETPPPIPVVTEEHLSPMQGPSTAGMVSPIFDASPDCNPSFVLSQCTSPDADEMPPPIMADDFSPITEEISQCTVTPTDEGRFALSAKKVQSLPGYTPVTELVSECTATPPDRHMSPSPAHHHDPVVTELRNGEIEVEQVIPRSSSRSALDVLDEAEIGDPTPFPRKDTMPADSAFAYALPASQRNSPEQPNLSRETSVVRLSSAGTVVIVSPEADEAEMTPPPPLAPPQVDDIDFTEIDLITAIVENTRILRSYAEYISGYDKLAEFIEGSTQAEDTQSTLTDGDSSFVTDVSTASPMRFFFKKKRAGDVDASHVRSSSTGFSQRMSKSTSRSPFISSTTPSETLREFLLDTESRLEGELGTFISRDTSLWGYLITPIQRLVQYRVLLMQLARYVSDERLDESIREISSVLEYCNQKKKESDGAQKVSEVQIRHNIPDLVKPGRYLIMEEELTRLSGGTYKPSGACRVYLFNDLFLSVSLSAWGTQRLVLICMDEVGAVEGIDVDGGNADSTGGSSPGRCRGFLFRNYSGRVEGAWQAVNARKQAVWVEAITAAKKSWKRRTVCVL